MRMILAHCGSLFLDPEALTDVYHRLVALELLHGAPEFFTRGEHGGVDEADVSFALMDDVSSGAFREKKKTTKIF